MWLRNRDNPLPFSKMTLAASRKPLTRGERRSLEYALTRAADLAQHHLAYLNSSTAISRGEMANRVDVLIGGLERPYRVLMEAEQADREKEEEVRDG